MAAIDQSWTKFSTEKFGDNEMLFGEKFQSKLTNRVEKETALAKAVSITNRHKGKESSSRKGGQSNSKFFRQGPFIRYGDGQIPNYNYRFLKDSRNLMRRMNCMRRRRIHGDNIVSFPPDPTHTIAQFIMVFGI